MKLNYAQQKLFNTITTLGWKGVLRVSGAGGTGKTFTVSQSLRALLEKEPDLRIGVVTITHQALANIRQKVCPSIADRIDFMTVARMLNKGLFSPSIGSKVATKGNTSRLGSYDLIVIDESSMVGQKESKLFLDSKVRIVEMGDFAQLPPVMAKANLFGQAKDFTQIHLSEQMRNGGEIYRVANVCRDHLYFPEKSVDNVLVHDTSEGLLQEFLKKLKTAENPTEVIFLAYTNDRVKEVAALAHRALYGESAFTEGQWLRMEQNINVESKGHNVQVVSVGNVVDVQGVACQEILVQGHSGDVEWVTCLLPGSAVKREAKMESIVEQVKAAQKNKQYDLVKVLTDAYEDLENGIVDVASPFALTIHKSQGQTISYVFVDTYDVSRGKGGFKKNLLYVAYSRASVELNTVFVPAKPKRDPSVHEFYQAIRKEVPLYSPLDIKIKHTIRDRHGKFNCASYEGKLRFVEVYRELVG